MNILVVSQYFWPENFRINELVKEWVKRGHEVVVLTGIPNYPMGQVFEEYRKSPKDFMNYEGARIVRVPVIARGTHRWGILLNYISFVLSGFIFGAWRLRGVKVDVTFVFEPSPVSVGLPAVWLSKLKKVPIVFWVLDLWPETLTAVKAVRSPWVLKCVGMLVHYIYRRCTLILGQSRGFIQSIQKYCDETQKVHYLPGWAEDMVQNCHVKPAAEVPNWPHGFTVVFAGNMGEAQDMPAVLDAAEQLRSHKSIRWVLVGDGRKSTWVSDEITRRGLNENVFMPGRYSLERMPSFFAHADALLVSLKPDPVFALTIPGKVQTYLMAGLPLLGMLDGEGSAVIQEAGVGLTCAAGDSIGLANNVLALASMPPEQRNRMGKQGPVYAKKEFDRGLLMDRLESLLKEAIAISKKNAHKELAP